MIYVALIVCIILLVTAGVIAWKNSRIIAEKHEHNGPNLSSMHYTVHITDHWVEQDSLTLQALFHTSYIVGEDQIQAYLCRVLGHLGELKLYEAENVMLHHIQHAKLKGSLLASETMCDYELSEDEKKTLSRLEEMVKNQQNE
ncbi:hypothetical protein [Paenibacillus crassostreae]|uniref:Uncharacterized protein n=1 Tax=Paenibacillus crassostreae TaxID=1763538 RepID=A0A167FR72_9BACL|nr:hypothetical protein [Paenibacillus crassostreae]AOZ94145.1 hypothetical protein LPB68_19420 [Paenibacillus crassostreae]OAB76819.1 hypothetical protein PNBC_05320 [Paenibacillus crassostreae]